MAARYHYYCKNCFLSCSNYSFNSCLYSILLSFIDARKAASLFILSWWISNSFLLTYALCSFCKKLSTCDLINISVVSLAVVIFRSISNRLIDDSLAFCILSVSIFSMRFLSLNSRLCFLSLSSLCCYNAWAACIYCRFYAFYNLSYSRWWASLARSASALAR